MALIIGGRWLGGWYVSHHGTQVFHSYSETAFPPHIGYLRVLFWPIRCISPRTRPRAPRGWKTLPRAPKSPNMRSGRQKLGYSAYFARNGVTRGAETQSKSEIGGARRRRFRPRSVWGRPVQQRVPGSTDCPGPVIQKSNPRFCRVEI